MSGDEKKTELEVEVAAFREAVRDTLTDWSCIDARTAPLAAIGAQLNELDARRRKAEERTRREVDVRARLVERTTRDLRRDLEQSEANEEAQRRRAEVAELRAKQTEAALAKVVAEAGEQRAALQKAMADSVGAAQAVIKALLARPHRVLEIYGQDVYQVAKDVFVSIGGDGNDLPAPLVAAVREAEERVQDIDQD